MHGIVGDLARTDKTAKPAPLLRFDCYVDTTSWLFPTRRLPKSEWTDLVELYGGQFHRKQNIRLGTLKLSFQCPQPELIHMLEELVVKYDGNLSRLDIGCDVRPGSTDLDYIEQTRLIGETMLMRDRDKGEFHVIENMDGTIGTIFCPHASDEKAKPRDIVLYPDPCSKLSHCQAVAHFDLRLRDHARRKAMREQGIGPKGKSLTTLDPSKLLRRHVRIVQVNMQKERWKYFKWLGEGLSLAKATRLIDDAKRNGQTEYVQRLRDQYPNCKVVDARNAVTFPHTLTWDATRRELQNNTSTGHMIKVNDDNDL
jgi:hypothetical protein